MTQPNITPNKNDIRKPQHIDGRKAALMLLRGLEKMNRKRLAPAKSRRAVKASLQCASAFSIKELDRFSGVLSDWLAADVIGLGINLGEYEAAMNKGARNG